MAHVEYGSAGVMEVAASSYADKSVTFSTTFGKTPKVLVSLSTGSTAAGMGSIQCGTLNESATGFTLRIWNNDSSKRTPTVNWVAIA